MKNEALEKKLLDMICSKQKEVPAAECEMVTEKIWEEAAKKECPSEDGLAALPPAFCNVMKNEALEKKLLDMICSKQKEVPAAECEMVTEKIWEEAAKKECTSEVGEMVTAEPCCQGHCKDSGKEKYYSVAESMSGVKHCGE